MHSNSLTSIR